MKEPRRPACDGVVLDRPPEFQHGIAVEPIGARPRRSAPHTVGSRERTNTRDGRSEGDSQQAILAIDIGGTSVKALASGQRELARSLRERHDACANGRGGHRCRQAVEVRRGVDRLSWPGRRARPAFRAAQSRFWLGRVRLCRRVRQAGENDERCGDAGARKLQRRAHVVPWSRYRPWLDPHHRERDCPA